MAAGGGTIGGMPEQDIPMESALLLIIPEAEPAVGVHRAEHEAAARVGVPAHITVAYPFKPATDLDPEDMSRLRALFAACPGFVVELAATGWFGSDVLFLDPRDADAIVRLTREVEAAFPDYPIYGGAFDGIHPHLTIAHDCGAEVLQTIAEEVSPSLPIIHTAVAVELWSGPALATQQSGWHLLERFPLGD